MAKSRFRSKTIRPARQFFDMFNRNTVPITTPLVATIRAVLLWDRDWRKTWISVKLIKFTADLIKFTADLIKFTAGGKIQISTKKPPPGPAIF